MSTVQTGDEHDEPTDPERCPSPDMLRTLLAEHGYDPEDLGQMIDLAAVGITARWWRNAKVEDWHAGADIGALSDVDMFRINTQTTAKVRQRLRTWCRQDSIHSMTDLAEANPDSLETVLYRLYRWFTNPRRVLITGSTLRDMVAQALANAPAHPDCELADDTTVESIATRLPLSSSSSTTSPMQAEPELTLPRSGILAGRRTQPRTID